MRIKFKKIDAIILVIMLLVTALVTYNTFFLETKKEKKEVISETPKVNVEKEFEKTELKPEPIPPESMIFGFMRAVSPEDEGKHFHKILTCREWWYFTVVLDEKSDLPGWTVIISFNHMAREDFLGQSKPDMMVLTIHGPNGEEYGGIITKERGLGIIKQPTLQAKTPGVNLEFEDSWVEGKAPRWHVHAEDNDIDKEHDIVVDLDFFTKSDPIWTFGERTFQKSKSNIANYMFTGCNVTGTIEIDGLLHKVQGTGTHEHSWTPHIFTKALIKEWDWFHIVLDNGWIIYFSNYRIRHNIIDSYTNIFNPLGTLLITTDQGKTFTVLESIETTVKKSDKSENEVFLFVKMPSKINVYAKTSPLQPFLENSNIELNLNIQFENTFDKVWKLPTYVGMKIGLSTVGGRLTWKDSEGEMQEVELEGTAASWSMRALI